MDDVSSAGPLFKVNSAKALFSIRVVHCLKLLLLALSSQVPSSLTIFFRGSRMPTSCSSRPTSQLLKTRRRNSPTQVTLLLLQAKTSSSALDDFIAANLTLAPHIGESKCGAMASPNQRFLQSVVNCQLRCTLPASGSLLCVILVSSLVTGTVLGSINTRSTGLHWAMAQVIHFTRIQASFLRALSRDTRVVSINTQGMEACSFVLTIVRINVLYI